MRLHHRFPFLIPRYDDEFVRRLLEPDALVAARLEPVYSLRYEGYLDLAFERDGEWLVLPLLCAEGVSIMIAENPAIAWPRTYDTFAGHATDAIDDRVLTWLLSITLGRLVNDEAVKFFRDEPHLHKEFEAARHAGWVGASPYPGVLRSVAPAVYAQRFAAGRAVAIEGEDAANMAAVLSATAKRLAIDSGDVARDDAARRWFAGLRLDAIDASEKYDVRIGARVSQTRATYLVSTEEPVAGERAVALAEPIPTDVMLSFDLQDGPLAREFAVREERVEVRRSCFAEPAAAGQSGGAIALVVRDDALRFPDADLDAARALEKRLRAEGFDANVCTAVQVDVGRTAVIHVFDVRHGAALVELVRDAELARVPIVVTPYADDRRNETISGCSGSLLIPRTASERVKFEDFLDAFARRKIANLTEGAWYDEASAVLMARAGAAIVASNAEAEFLRERFGYTGTCVPVAATVPIAAAEEAIGSLVGPDEFILIHAPIEPRANQVFAALAAQQLDLPLILLGPVGEIEFYRYVNEVCGPRTIALRDDTLTPGEIAGIYGRARVFADLSWSSRGLHRLARAASTGAAVVAPASGYAADLFGELVAPVDQATFESIVAAFSVAWTRQPQVGPRLISLVAHACDPFSGLVATLSAYQQAGSLARP